MKRDLLTIAAYFFAMIGMLLLMYSIWNVVRPWIYSVSYGSLVKETICESVNQDYLEIKCDET